LKELGVEGKLLLNPNIQISVQGSECTNLAEESKLLWPFVNVTMKIGVSQKEEICKAAKYLLVFFKEGLPLHKAREWAG
jgi:hypothetical protein